MFKPFPDDMQCPVCNKNLNDVALSKEVCIPCATAGERITAERTVLAHIWDGLKHVFNFEFLHALAAFKWAQERWCKSGDYDRKTGKFYIKKYLKD